VIRNLIINRENWDKIAVIEGEKDILYRDLAQKALTIQKMLSQKQKENIAILLPNGSDYIAAFYGTIMSGMTVFPLNALMTKHEVIPLLAQASVHTVITSNRFSPLFTGLTESEAPDVNIIYIEELPIYDGDDLPAAANIGADEPMVLLGTSGTTGNSKLVQLSENNVASAVLGYMGKMDFDGINDIRFILGAPFSSAYGMMILSVCLMQSFPIVLVNDKLTLDAFYKAVEAHRVTHYEGGTSVILMMEQMADRPIPYDISSLRYLAFGGSKVSGETIKKLFNAYPGVEFYQGYGMTEASPLVTKRPIKPNSVGLAIKGVKIAIDADGMITDIPYTKGEIVVKGPNIMLGYYKNEEETNKVLKNGYLFTGDIGYLDEDGDLYICGRKKNLIIVRGFNVQPEEVEECILNSSLVKDCIVYGRTNEFGTEIICTDVVPMNSQVEKEDIWAYFHSHLAEYKQPQIINFCDEIPKNLSGKTERTEGCGQGGN
jgi:long-chain acyl-CoA synthetase